MNVNKLVPGMVHVNVAHDDGAICGVMILQCKKSKKFYVGFCSNLYNAVNTTASKLRNGIHPNQRLQSCFNEGGVKYFTFPTDTVGEAVDLRNSIIDEFYDKTLNIYSADRKDRVKKQVARWPNPRTAQRVMVDGVVYESRRECALAHGFTVSTVAYRIKNPAYKGWTAA